MKNNYIIEITLISAQGLKKTTTFRRMRTYAVAWIDSSVKLRSCIDCVGGENPTWNDKFLFKVSSEFLYSETSGISIEIFADGIFRDTLVGTVRLLVGNLLRDGSSYIAIRVPSFSAVQVRRPSGGFQGVINIGASVLWTSDVPAMSGVSAMGFHNLFQENRIPKGVRRSHSSIGISYENRFVRGSTYSSSPSTSMASKERKRMIKEMEETKHARSSSDGAILGVGLGLSPKKAAYLHPFGLNQRFHDRKLTKVRSSLTS
ncbi:hypothetical protein E1A91_D08G265900v1 [Gossypium mustelinum]|uniref:C2 domain-containing protein n=1 Tax=Gossypium mustelinum TaxID=34275 RepID=A0A5D2U370_GOSMU|nr:hypothetical protein E1A91_D08G265900v1 [Gossypium mustelinum]